MYNSAIFELGRVPPLPLPPQIRAGHNSSKKTGRGVTSSLRHSGHVMRRHRSYISGHRLKTALRSAGISGGYEDSFASVIVTSRQTFAPFHYSDSTSTILPIVRQWLGCLPAAYHARLLSDIIMNKRAPSILICCPKRPATHWRIAVDCACCAIHTGPPTGI